MSNMYGIVREIGEEVSFPAKCWYSQDSSAGRLPFAYPYTGGPDQDMLVYFWTAFICQPRNKWLPDMKQVVNQYEERNLPPYLAMM